MPLAPVDGHEECAPRHSRIDDVAEGEVVEALQYLAHLSGPRNDDNPHHPPHKDWSQAAQAVGKMLEEPKMIEKMAYQSVTSQEKDATA
jgi:hypothetical protein